MKTKAILMMRVTPGTIDIKILSYNSTMSKRGDFSRNNLYWYEKGKFVCLWYSNEYVMPEDVVEGDFYN